MNANANMNMAINSAIHLSNNGCFLLSHGESTKSLRVFAQALRILNDAVLRADFGLEGTDANGVPCVAMPYLIPSFLQNESFYVYNQAMLLKPLENDHPLAGYDACSTSAVIIFNMALAFHYLGNNRKAVYMYGECEKLLDAEEFGTADLQMIVLAAANNMATISYQDRDYEGLEQQLESVQENYFRVRNSSASAEILDEHCMDEMALNFTTLSMRPSAASAA
jgi:hypothetical protein